MPSNSFEEFINSATQSIQAGQFAAAIEMIDQAIALQPDNSDAHMLRGIALAQTGSASAATASLEEAVRLAPTSAKAHYNLAKHLLDQGDSVSARASADEALRLDPSNVGARELLSRLDPTIVVDQGVPSLSPPSESGSAPATDIGYYRPAGVEGQVHSLQFVEKLGKTWVMIGWGIAGLGLALFLYNLPQQIQAFSAAMSNPGAFRGGNSQFALGTPVGVVVMVVGLMRLLASILWMTFDVVDRRTKMIWLLPYFLCCCCGLDWGITFIYLIAEKRTN